MIAATLFSGIGAPECAMPHWDWRWHAEIEKFPSAVMAARHPQSVNLGDVNAEDFVERAERIGRPDVLVFGSPCQDFSVAGQRVGLDGDRGNLALVALGIAAKLRPRWVVFENVPGLLSSRSGSAAAERALRDRGLRGDAGVGDHADAEEDSDFAAFLALVQQCGYFGAYRIVDAQFAGIPQRRRRIFAVFHLGDWRPGAAVLFEPESLRGDHPPSREAREGVAGTISARTQGGGGLGTDFDLSGGLNESSGEPQPGLPLPGLRGDQRRDVVADVRMVRPSADRADPARSGADGFNNQGHGWWARDRVAQTVRAGDDAGNGGARESTLVNDQGVTGSLSASTGEASQQDAERGLLVFGGNNTSGPIDQATAVRAKSGTGHGDFESETFVVDPVSFDCKAGGATSFAIGDQAGAQRASHGGGHSAVLAFEDRTRGDDGRGYDREPNFIENVSPALNTVKTPTIAFNITPSNSNKDYNARQSDRAQSVTGSSGAAPSARGGDVIVTPILEAGARTGKSTTDVRAGLGDAEAGDPMYMLQSGKQHAVAINLRGREGGAMPEVSDAASLRSPSGGSSRSYIAFQSKQSATSQGPSFDSISPALDTAKAGGIAVFKPSHYTRGKDGQPSGVSPPLGAEPDKGDQDPVLFTGAAVRRLTPRECERLQAFPDDFTLIKFRGKPAADGPRYKSLGNSMCVLDVRWVLQRIETFEAMQKQGEKQ